MKKRKIIRVEIPQDLNAAIKKVIKYTPELTISSLVRMSLRKYLNPNRKP